MSFLRFFFYNKNLLRKLFFEINSLKAFSLFQYILLQYEICLSKRYALKFFKTYFITLESIIGIKPVIRKIYFRLRRLKKKKKKALYLILNLCLRQHFVYNYLDFLFLYLINFGSVVNKTYNLKTRIIIFRKIFRKKNKFKRLVKKKWLLKKIKLLNFFNFELKNFNDILNVFYFSFKTKIAIFSVSNYFIVKNSRDRNSLYTVKKYLRRYKKL